MRVPGGLRQGSRRLNSLQARERDRDERSRLDAEAGLKGLGSSYPASSEFSLTDDLSHADLWRDPSHVGLLSLRQPLPEPL